MTATLKTTIIQEPSSATANMTLGTTGGVTFGAAATTNTITSAAATNLTIQSAGTTAMTIDTSQNVGIGTTSPATKLHVSGYVSSGGQNYSGRFSDAINSTYSIAHQSGLTNLITDTAMAFYTGNIERMRIDTSGNLLVGTASQAGAGKTVIRFTPGVTTGTAYQQSIDTSAPTPLNFLNAAGTSVGSVTTTSSATAYNVSSDYRLKENVNPISTGLATISALKPVTYDWIIDKTAGEGFIAHELKEIVPLAVHGEKDAVDADGNPIHQGVDYSKIVVHLVAAVQEQQAMITALTARITALEVKP
jgi:hypothetical protein